MHFCHCCESVWIDAGTMIWEDDEIYYPVGLCSSVGSESIMLSCCVDGFVHDLISRRNLPVTTFVPAMQIQDRYPLPTACHSCPLRGLRPQASDLRPPSVALLVVVCALSIACALATKGVCRHP